MEVFGGAHITLQHCSPPPFDGPGSVVGEGRGGAVLHFPTPRCVLASSKPPHTFGLTAVAAFVMPASSDCTYYRSARFFAFAYRLTKR